MVEAEHVQNSGETLSFLGPITKKHEITSNDENFQLYGLLPPEGLTEKGDSVSLLGMLPMRSHISPSIAYSFCFS